VRPLADDLVSVLLAIDEAGDEQALRQAFVTAALMLARRAGAAPRELVASYADQMPTDEEWFTDLVATIESRDNTAPLLHLVTDERTLH
jgi:hypothetical protein